MAQANAVRLASTWRKDRQAAIPSANQGSRDPAALEDLLGLINCIAFRQSTQVQSGAGYGELNSLLATVKLDTTKVATPPSFVDFPVSGKPPFLDTPHPKPG